MAALLETITCVVFQVGLPPVPKGTAGGRAWQGAV